MHYEVFQPALPLRPYIDMYWRLRGVGVPGENVSLMPDSAVTLVLNLGEDYRSKHYPATIRNEGIFLIGATLRADEQVLQGEVHLLGIQFKPGAFSHFYRYQSLHQTLNQVQEFERRLFPDVDKMLRYFVPYLDRFFIERLDTRLYSPLPVAADMLQLGGQARLDALAKKHFTTERQLERQFRQHIGISPKEFINLVRFRQAFEAIQQRPQGRSLIDIAWEYGYYDHAHLSNDFKRYTGQTPSRLILSDFSKTINNVGE